MATIKLQPSGKVVLKDGKVACGCCEEPEGCCMYPATAVNTFYVAADLPDAVTVNGVSFNRSSTNYGNTSNGVVLEGTQWAKYTNGVRSARDCLIQGGVVDQFANTYLVTPNVGDGASPTTVYRQSLCQWQGVDTCGNFVYLSYGTNPDSGDDLVWNVMFFFYIDCVIDGAVRGQKNEEFFQNNPEGIYSGTFENAATVS